MRSPGARRSRWSADGSARPRGGHRRPRRGRHADGGAAPRRAAWPRADPAVRRLPRAVVCPDAGVKSSLPAPAESRARRLHAELAEQGVSADRDTIRDEVKVRDRQDTTRVLAPLVKAADAIEIDTSDLSIDEVV